MKSYLKLLLAVFLTTTGSINFANASASADLESLLGGLHTMQADFKQTVYDNLGKSVQKSFGHMALQRPGKFRWQVTKPIPQLIIANDKRLWIYDPDLMQVTIRSLKLVAGDTPALLLSQVGSVIEKDYAVSVLAAKKAGTSRFQLIPRGADNMFATVEMTFSQQKLVAMNLKDHLGHRTSIEFSRNQSNSDLSPGLFTFKPPANVDVIDETKRH